MTVTTQGGYDPASGRHAYGLYNGPSGTVTSGGAAEISNSTISTLGEGMHGVVTGAGGTTALAGTNVSTVGARACSRPCLRRRRHEHQRRLDRDRGAERLWRQRRWRQLPDRPLVSDDRDLWRRRDRAARPARRERSPRPGRWTFGRRARRRRRSHFRATARRSRRLEAERSRPPERRSRSLAGPARARPSTISRSARSRATWSSPTPPSRPSTSTL